MKKRKATARSESAFQRKQANAYEALAPRGRKNSRKSLATRKPSRKTLVLSVGQESMLAGAASQLFRYLAMDLLTELGGDASIPREEAIELVLDADRLSSEPQVRKDPTLVKFLDVALRDHTSPEREQLNKVMRTAFPYRSYSL